MDRMPINNEKHFAVDLTQEPSEESQEHLSTKFLLKDHEIEMPPIRESRDHVAPKPFPRSGNDRSLPTTPIGAACRMIGPEPHLIDPVNLSFLSLRLHPNRRVMFLQPAPHFLRVLFKGPTSWLLRTEAPPSQIPTNRPQRKSDAKLVLDQLSNCLSGPQVEGQLQLVGTAIGHGLGNLSRLPGKQRSSPRPTSLFSSEGLTSSLSVGLYPFAKGLAGNPEDLGDLNLFATDQNSFHRLLPKVFLRGSWQRTSISDSHARSIHEQN
jgi:hypothetical protein